jgi:hypothetical protein
VSVIAATPSDSARRPKTYVKKIGRETTPAAGDVVLPGLAETVSRWD